MEKLGKFYPYLGKTKLRNNVVFLAIPESFD
jgi:hypothetical protein